jgi:RHS repeat-associated protein
MPFTGNKNRKMVKKVKAIGILLFSSMIFAECALAQVVRPAVYRGNATVNYVREWLATAPIQDAANLITRPLNDVKQSTQYFDGLGRPLQTVIRQMSPAGGDLVTPVIYDEFGREMYKFLPFVANAYQTGDQVNDGNFKSDPFQQQAAFGSAQYGIDSFLYGKTDFEASPLNRPLKTAAPGNSWVGNNKGVSSQYLANTAADSVRIWTIAATAGSTPGSTSMYGAGLLFKNGTADEQGHQVWEYKDKEGRIILKKVQLWNTPAAGHSGWLCTYYIYDDLGNLRFVIQPRAVEWLISNSWAFGGTYGPLAVNELCFRYDYDQRNRMIIKKVPGAGEVRMVYDARDRLIMTQDANLRVQSPAKWMVTEYDSLNRPYRTGLLTNANDRAYHQNLAYNSISYPSTAANYEVLTQSFYDDYAWVSSSGSGLSTSMATNRTSDGNLFYTTYNASPTYAVPMTSYPVTTGMPVGSMTKVLNSSPAQYLYTVNFYDDHGRVIQSQSSNYRNGIDTVTIQYDFSGKPLRTFLGHKKAGAAIQNHSVLTKMSYDAAGRSKNILKNIDGTGDQLIDSVQYDELGQLKNKFLGNLVDSLAYAYNIRGWLTSINKNYLTGGTTSTRNYFGLDLGYDNAHDATGGTYARPALNGNISGTLWKSGGDNMVRKYDFTYDSVNRLTGADYNQLNGSTYNKGAGVDFSVTGLAYDANGNILSMKQRGLTGTSSSTIDSLTYSYNFSGISNRLVGVTDGTNNQSSVLGDFHYNPNGKGAVDYTYDQNGNMITDFNKGINPITYNYLNLPQQVHMAGKGNIIYTYDAGGNKLAKVTMDSLSRHATTTIYINGFVYQQGDTITNPTAGIDTLQFMGHEEGRARWAFHRYSSGATGYKWEYDFFEQDHLGNTREVLTQQRDTAKYMATLEAAYRATENALFYNIGSTNVWSYYVNGAAGPNPFGTGVTNPNDSVSQINGNTPKEGPAIILKVMAGDTYKVAVQSFWKSGQTSTGTTDALTDILSSLANGIVSAAGGTKGSYATLSNTTTSPLLGGVNSFRSANNPTPPTNPKAYLNYVVLDNQFNYDATSSGARPVGAADILLPLTDSIRVKKNGYLYIYLSNETKGVSVFFDNLSVTHYSGPLLEETHYYPGGLVMAGISDRALKQNYAENKRKYNAGSELQNKEFSDGMGLELYTTNYRLYDPQLVIFRQIDPLAEINEDQSTYSYAQNNPVLYNDPLGLLSDSSKPQVLQTATVTGHKNSTTSSIPLLPLSPVHTRAATDNVPIGMAPRVNPSMRFIPAEQANMGMKQPAYAKGTMVTQYRTTMKQKFVRVFNLKNGNSAQGQWMMKESEIQGLSPEQIQSRFALPGQNLPNQMVEVEVPAGTLMQVGYAGTNSFGTGGGVQFELMQEIPVASFGTPMALPVPSVPMEMPGIGFPEEPILPEGEIPDIIIP